MLTASSCLLVEGEDEALGGVAGGVVVVGVVVGAWATVDAATSIDWAARAQAGSTKNKREWGNIVFAWVSKEKCVGKAAVACLRDVFAIFLWIDPNIASGDT